MTLSFVLATFLLLALNVYSKAVSDTITNPQSTSITASMTLSTEELENADDITFKFFMVNYLKAKDASHDFIQKMEYEYSIQRSQVRSLFVKLMTSDKELNESFEAEFNKFLKHAPEWAFTKNDENNVIFWNNDNYQTIENLKILRRQRSRLGSMIAPVVLMHFMISINSNGAYTQTLDISKYTNYIKKGEQLEEFIEEALRNKAGEFSYAVMKEMMQLEDSDISKIGEISDYGPILLKKLAHYPAIISAFTVYSQFLDEPRIYKYHHKLPGEMVRGYHSLLLVGARRDLTSGEYYYLLQNFWEGKYFIEVSGEYLDSVKPAIVMFVTKKISNYPPEYADLTNNYLSAETLDMSDMVPNEDV